MRSTFEIPPWPERWMVLVLVYVMTLSSAISAVGTQVPVSASSSTSLPSSTTSPRPTTTAESYASECKIWSSVASGLLTGPYSSNGAVCYRNSDCSGFTCTNLTDKQSSGDPRENLFSFAVEINTCSFPLQMSVHLEYIRSTRLDQSISIQSSGAVNYSLPHFNGDKDSVRQLGLKWVSTLRPIRYHIELEVNYTLMRSVAGVLQTLENIVLVPGVSVPIPDCRNLFGGKSTVTPGGPTVSPIGEVSPGISTENPKRDLTTVTPLVITGTVVVLCLVLLLVVLLHRRRFAARLSRSRGRGSFRHSKLVNDDYITDDHILQI